MSQLTVLDFRRMKQEGRKISMVTCYDAWSARIIDESSIDTILVGDSVAMVVHGFPSTVNATTEMMALHIEAVARGAKRKFIIGDMPFGSFRKGIPAAMDCVERLMKAGAQAVKLEGVWGHEDVVRHIVQSGVPVMGHIGLTPQSIHQLGGFRVQGRDQRAAEDLIAQARKLEELGCFGVVLECIPAQVAREITKVLSVPTIGIGAGAQADGQVLVLQDLWGADPSFKPKFVKRYGDAHGNLLQALNRYHDEVVRQAFPSEGESYT